MPEISRFYGIIIAMFYDDHNPPHFHARYGGSMVAVEIGSLRILEGRIPPRALGMVMEWATAISIFDPDHSESEDTWITIGISEKGRLLIVAHTFREEREDAVTIRIISSRKATRRETKTYGE
jgi:uncharacterized DUF497 family protein